MADFKQEYTVPYCWNSRTPLCKAGMLFDLLHINFYFDLNDNKVRRFLSDQKGLVADLGCGDGRFLSYADVGIDFSKGMLKRAKNTYSRHLVRASVLCLPFRTNSFNFAFMSDVLVHIEPKNRMQAVDEMKRISINSKIFNADRSWLNDIVANLQDRIGKRLALIFGFLVTILLDRCVPRGIAS